MTKRVGACTHLHVSLVVLSADIQDGVGEDNGGERRRDTWIRSLGKGWTSTLGAV